MQTSRKFNSVSLVLNHHCSAKDKRSAGTFMHTELQVLTAHYSASSSLFHTLSLALDIQLKSPRNAQLPLIENKCPFIDFKIPFLCCKCSIIDLFIGIAYQTCGDNSSIAVSHYGYVLSSRILYVVPPHIHSVLYRVVEALQTKAIQICSIKNLLQKQAENVSIVRKIS